MGATGLGAAWAGFLVFPRWVPRGFLFRGAPGQCSASLWPEQGCSVQGTGPSAVLLQRTLALRPREHLAPTPQSGGSFLWNGPGHVAGGPALCSASGHDYIVWLPNAEMVLPASPGDFLLVRGQCFLKAETWAGC